MIVQSERLDDIIALAHTWRQLPSTLALRYMPELRTRHQVTPADLFAFDVAATARWADLRHEHETRQADGRQRGAGPQRAAPSALRPGAVRDTGEVLAMRGNEIPPWDSRYRGAKRRR